jgi:formylglycine-generating enzyme required for sulfatase activity
MKTSSFWFFSLLALFSLAACTAPSPPPGASAALSVSGGGGADWVQIPAGTFEMGDHNGVGNEGPLHSVTLDAFKMDVYEVTNELYAAYLNDVYAAGSVTVNSNVIYQVGGAGEALADTTASSSYSRITWNGSTFGVTAGKEQHPLVEVSWYGACAYANWRSEQRGLTPCYDLSTWACDFNANGWRLPTEAEWEYAARGGAHNPYYKYPWNSNSITSSDANYDRNIGTTCDVGNYAPNGYGLYDTAGNVWEWCNDWYSSSYYSSSPGSNPTGPSSGSGRVLRGGSWGNSAVNLRAAARYYNYANNRNHYVGLRLLSVH